MGVKMETKEHILERFGWKKKVVQKVKTVSYILNVGMLLGSVYFLDKEKILELVEQYW